MPRVLWVGGFAGSRMLCTAPAWDTEQCKVLFGVLTEVALCPPPRAASSPFLLLVAGLKRSA